MAFVLEDGTGKTDSNSYVSLVEYKAYWADLNDSSTGEADAAIQARLIKATRYIDMNYEFMGARANADQALEFPRTNLYNRYGDEIDDDVIINDLKYAVSELAKAAIVNSEIYTNDSKIKAESLGPESVTYKDGVSLDAYPVVTNYLKPYLRGTSLQVNRV